MEVVRRGPWTVEEDLALINYIAHHGEGRWNSLARSAAGLKRSGKSCRLRWLNYLRPDVRRGNITLEEQLLILELHSRWGNRWSKIAQHLPGRTDNEIKNYWRTRVQKHAKHLNCDVNSNHFKDTMRYLWIPRLLQAIHSSSSSSSNSHHQIIDNSTATMAMASSSSSSDNINYPINHLQDYYPPPSNNDCLKSNHQHQQQGLIMDFIIDQNSTTPSQSQWMDSSSADNFWNNVDDIWF